MKNQPETSGSFLRSKADKVFDVCVLLILVLVGLIVLYPLLFTVSASISEPNEVNLGRVILLPKGIHFSGYTSVFNNKWIMIGYRNSLIYMAIGTLLNVTATFMAAFALSRRDLVGRAFLNWFIAIPMWFSGGLIPTYLTVNSYGLVNQPAVLVILGLVSSYNLIICRTFLSGLPFELQESAKIDGANEFQIMVRIMLPLSSAILGVLSLYYAVGHWNSYFNAMIYINNKNYMPLQVFLREILLLNANIDPNQIVDVEVMLENQRRSEVMKYSLIIVATLPMLVLYPMLQKYFIKGVLIGSVKG